MPISKRTFGDLAIENGFVGVDQAVECLEIQRKMKEMGIDRTLGAVMHDKQYLTLAQVRAILRDMTGGALEPEGTDPSDDAPAKPHPRLDGLFGEVAVEKGLLTAEQVAECRDIQAKLAALGIAKTIGAVAHAKKLLSLEQVKEILRELPGRAARPGQ